MAVLDACQDAKQSVTVDDLCLRFAGRTDKGVHATGQVVTITAPLLRKERDGAPGHLRKSINSRLPVDVSVERIECLGACDPDNVVLDPRRDVINKTYSYAIKFRRKLRGRRENENNGTDCHRHAFDPPCLWTCPWPLDDSKLPDLCHRLSGTHDYLNFWHKEERKKFDADDGESSSVMTVQCQWQLEKEQKNAEGDVVVVGRFLFSAKGFRRSMIRNLVGYCVDVCRGLEEVAKMDLERQVLRKQSCVSDNSSTAPQIHSAPASGLCLQSVTY
jgi:tRNA pseudouridine(38-40) synthase